MTTLVKVLHSFIADDGEWKFENTEVDLPDTEAVLRENDGYVDRLSIDGTVVVLSACCSEHG